MRTRSLLALLLLFPAVPAASSADHEAGLPLHASILINGDEDICGARDQGVTNCGWADGSEANPYVISGWRFHVDQSYAARIIWTTKHIDLRGNEFVGGTPGGNQRFDAVRLDFTRDIALRENHFTDLGWAALLYGATDTVIVANTFERVSLGVYSTPGAGSTVIEANLFKEGGFAIDAYGGTVQVRLNQFRGNSVDLMVQEGPDLVLVRRNNFDATRSVAAWNMGSDLPVDA